MMKKIILFGGSFDPIHNGHLKMASQALKELEADEVIFIPAKNPRWKEQPSDQTDRLKMLALALRYYPRFHVSSIELDSPDGGFYTIDTIKELFKKDEENGQKKQYYYLIGEDHLEKLSLWHDIETLANLVQFVAYDRGDDSWSPLARQNATHYHVRLLKGRRHNVSSTMVRNLQSIDVPFAVLKYIVDHHLYRYHEIYDLVGEKRYLHSSSVAFLAKKIAKNNKISEYKAFVAGILHDVGKYLDRKEEGKRIMEEEWADMKSLPLVTFHQFIGATLAKNRFNIDDLEIIDAIAYHCTGKSEMGTIGKIIYASDKIEPLRGYDSSEYIAACLSNIESGFIIVLRANKEFLEEKNRDIHNYLSDACFDYYLGGN